MCLVWRGLHIGYEQQYRNAALKRIFKTNLGSPVSLSQSYKISTYVTISRLNPFVDSLEYERLDRRNV